MPFSFPTRSSSARSVGTYAKSGTLASRCFSFSVLSRALASKPGDRFGTAREFVRELAGALVPETATTQVFHGAATRAFSRPTRIFPQAASLIA